MKHRTIEAPPSSLQGQTRVFCQANRAFSCWSQVFRPERRRIFVPTHTASMTSDVAVHEAFLAVIKREVDGEEVPGVLVQGPNAPCILTCLHAFQNDAKFQQGKHYPGLLYTPNEPIDMVLSELDVEYDFAVFQLVTHINRVTAPVDTRVSSSYVGAPYTLYGKSACSSIDSAGRWIYTWNAQKGHISTYLLDGCRMGAGGGCARGDSGGPLFHGDTGKLIGINLSVALLHPGPSLLVSTLSRASPQGRFIPLWVIEMILKSKHGKPYFGDGAVIAEYRPPFHVSTSNNAMPLCESEKVHQQPFEMLCDVASSPLEDLVDPNLLDPYQN